MRERRGELSFLVAVVAVLSSVGCGLPPAEEEALGQQSAGVIQQVTSFGSNPGGLKMYRYVPQGMPPNAPVVLALHGCTQTAKAYEGAGWNALADKYKFYVVYPEQDSNNNAAGCFNWGGEYGDPTNLKRGQGENLSIKQMVDKMKADFSVDPSRVFITGFSGGGAQVALMLATWPDVFAAGGILAGIPYNCTTTFSEVSSCLNPGKDLTPSQWGQRIKDGFPGYAGPFPRLSIWAGASDAIVSPNNQNELLEQFSEFHGIDRVADVEDQVQGHPRKQYRDASGKTVIETWRVSGMGHGVPVDASAGCGSAGSYLLDVKLCSSEYIARFFGIAGGSSGGDTLAPKVSITSPANGATVSGVVLVEVSATDDVGVASVDLLVNGAVHATRTGAPYQFSVDTAKLGAGTHSLIAIARDAAKNSAQAQVSVVISGGPDLTPPVTAATPRGGTYSGKVAVQLASNEPGTTYFTVDGTEPDTTSPKYAQPLTFTSDTTLKFFSVDGAGNREATQTEQYVVTPPGKVVFTSLEAEDGYVGDVWWRGVGSAALRAGDIGMYNRDSLRIVLSFDTSSLPDDARVTGAVLRVFRKSVKGAVSRLTIDGRRGHFGYTTGLSQSDYASVPTVAGVGELPVPAADDAPAELTLPNGALQVVNVDGRTQFRLKADTAWDFAADEIVVHGGEAGALAPVLEVTFQ